jgi:beta-xylosidase
MMHNSYLILRFNSLLLISIFFLLSIISYPQHKYSRFLENSKNGIWIADNGDGTYKNPIIYSDYSDPDVIRVGDDYFLTSSSFVNTPGLPILHSKDLVNWKIVNYVFNNIPYGKFDKPQHGNGVWAPSIRYHNGEFYIYYGDPDYGILMSKTKDPFGKWEPLTLVKEARGWIDPCPLWDDDGNAYLVHAMAKSRAGIKSILIMNKMSDDGKTLLDDGVLIFDGTKNHPTIEGPKLYKRNGYYYIMAPAGGVSTGWQVVLRSRNVFGPYEDKVVLHQGSTTINGPHQGGWVEIQSGESWFIHFQDKDAYGRILHLQPVKWVNDWPIIGKERDTSEIGEPVLAYKKPDAGNQYPISIIQTNDEFNTGELDLQWQWEANHSEEWYSLKDNKGNLRLNSIPLDSDTTRIWDIPNVIAQKFPAPEYTVTTKLKFSPKKAGEKTGLIITGMNYAYLSISNKTVNNNLISLTTCMNADSGGHEDIIESKSISNDNIYLRVEVKNGGICHFSYSADGKKFISIGKEFIARKGKWIGAKVGLFATAPYQSKMSGYADYDWFRFSK